VQGSQSKLMMTFLLVWGKLLFLPSPSFLSQVYELRELFSHTSFVVVFFFLPSAEVILTTSLGRYSAFQTFSSVSKTNSHSSHERFG